MEMTMEQLRTTLAASIEDGMGKALKGFAQPVAVAVADKPASIADSQIVTMGMADLYSLVQQGKVIDTQGKKLSWEDVNDYAVMHRVEVGGMIEKWDRVGGLGVPWASAIVGSFIGLAENELIEGFAGPAKDATGNINFINPLAKLGVAWVDVKFGSKFLGKMPMYFAAGVLVFSIAADFLPFRKWASDLRTKFSMGMEPIAEEILAPHPSYNGYSRADNGVAKQISEHHQVLPGHGAPGPDKLASVFAH